MKTILLAEDDALLCQMMAESLRLADKGYTVHAVPSGLRAQTLLEQQPVDLLITDLSMPGVDGLMLLSFLQERRMRIPVIVVSGRITPDVEPLVRSLGAETILEKPFDLSVLLATVKRVLLASEYVPEDRIRGFTLPSFLQLMALDGKTSVVRVLASQSREGHLRFLGGQLVGAAAGTASGDDAALEILGWPEPEIRLANLAEPLPPNVQTSLSGLLMRSAQAQDEREGEAARGASLSVV